MLLHLLLFIGVSISFAQNTVPMMLPVPATKLEIFAARKNATITTETYYVTRLPADSECNIRLQALILYEAGRENEQVRGLKVELSQTQRTKEEHVHDLIYRHGRVSPVVKWHEHDAGHDPERHFPRESRIKRDIVLNKGRTHIHDAPEGHRTTAAHHKCPSA